MEENKGYSIFHSDGSTKEVESKYAPIIDRLAADNSDESINNFYDPNHTPSNTVKITKDNSTKDVDVRSKEYKELYDSGHLTNYNPKTGIYHATPKSEVIVSAKKQYDYEGCVTGLCNSLSEKNKESVESFRKMNNLYGDAWDFNKTNYGKDVDISKDYSNLKEDDIINLSRESFASDKTKGIPNKNQHIGYISKIENGVPFVKHYISNVGLKSDGKTPYGEYFEEPINNISEKYKYTASGARRIDSKKDITYKDSNFKFDENYKPNEVEQGILKAHEQKKELQKVLSLDSDEYDDLAKIAYGIIGNESNYGMSKRMLYRMAIPDFVQKGVKVAHDEARNVKTLLETGKYGKLNVYDDNINNLSQGYSSTKESSLHGVSSDNPNETSSQIAARIKKGDYKGLTKDNNFLNTALNKLGINTDVLDNGENSTKAVMATLAWYKKRNPEATSQDLLRMYTGKKNITKYEESHKGYMKNINTNPLDNKEYSWFDTLLGKATTTSHKIDDKSKKINSDVVSFIRDNAPTPENANALFGDMMGGKKDITEKSLSPSTLQSLTELVKENLSKGKTDISYNDYGTSEDKNSDVGKGSVSMTKMATDEKYILKTLLGQASIVKIDDNTYEIQDFYDFNDKGKSFGVIDDLKKRGYSPYAIVRALGRNYGSGDKMGSKVKIKVKIN